jgi:hypothetical protein
MMMCEKLYDFLQSVHNVEPEARLISDDATVLDALDIIVASPSAERLWVVGKDLHLCGVLSLTSILSCFLTSEVDGMQRSTSN